MAVIQNMRQINLPNDVHDLIYLHLDGKSRCKMRMAMSKKNIKYGLRESKEKSFTIAERYIDRNREELLQKQMSLPQTIYNFLEREASQKDPYARKLLKKAGIVFIEPVSTSHQIYDVNTLMVFIKNKSLTQKILTDHVKESEQCKFIDSKHVKEFRRIIATACTPAIFDMLMDHEITEGLIEEMLMGWGCEDFVFSMVNMGNTDLLKHIFEEGFKYAEKCHVQEMINYITNSETATIFKTKTSINGLLTCFRKWLSRDVLEMMRKTCEEELNCDSVFLLDTYLQNM